MFTERVETLIVGGGLSGLFAGYLLSQQKQSFVLLEARDRLGGRIYSPEYQGFHTDLGPSWYWPEIHPKMHRLIDVLGLSGYPQFEMGMGRFQRVDGAVQNVRGYTAQPRSFRLVGGMTALVDRLFQDIPKAALYLDHPVCQIEREPHGALVSVGTLEKTPSRQFYARNVILALPPRLAAATILFAPELSHELTQAMLKTGTWMAGQAKFFALYDSPFWREKGLSGQAFSDCGPLAEIHDGSNQNKGPYGLTGFVGLPAVQRRQTPRMKQTILGQLEQIFGRPAAQPAAFFYRDWSEEQFTATSFDQPPMTVHPVYCPPAGQTAIWNGCIRFAGTETADAQGGYLEGALASAERAVRYTG